MKPKTILHSDCNGFYAGVECLLNPELNNRPMAVCGDPASRHGIVLAKNEKAKAFGVATAETIWQARRKCPDLALVPPHREEYVKYSRLCNEIYLRFTDLVEPFGIDESFLDVSSSRRLFGDGKTIADKIRETVRRELGLTVSVGVSFNKIFAKLGSDYKKPDATTLIPEDGWQSIVWPLPVGALLFVGRKRAAELSKLQIRTIGDLAAYDRAALVKRLGQAGAQLHDHANGVDESPVASFYAEREVKSVGNGATFEYDVTDHEDLKTRVLALCDSVGWRLRKKNLKCRSLQVSIKDPNFKTINRQKTLERPTNLTMDLYRDALELISVNWLMGKPIRLITVTAGKLEQAEKSVEQLNIFEDPGEIAKQEALQSAVDSIREKYGKDSITPGALRPRGASSGAKREK
ncbi:MAG: DNA polymerase IV [Clostridiales Family XIII bacterium]|jgi:DNA polymerase-4|nr:DNA polymerase IV [Clostridiales Family XIII bacterium]